MAWHICGIFTHSLCPNWKACFGLVSIILISRTTHSAFSLFAVISPRRPFCFLELISPHSAHLSSSNQTCMAPVLL
ncbi:hypothetical protein B0O99DRAFT_273389 [Bisporella sp. PMI_857]|nr:hypothetical protein B0O99DRAFT_273389 [Bisporella sp. PMI_857]